MDLAASSMMEMGYGVWETTLILGVGSYQFNYANGAATESISGDCDWTAHGGCCQTAP